MSVSPLLSAETHPTTLTVLCFILFANKQRLKKHALLLLAQSFLQIRYICSFLQIQSIRKFCPIIAKHPVDKKHDYRKENYRQFQQTNLLQTLSIPTRSENLL